MEWKMFCHEFMSREHKLYNMYVLHVTACRRLLPSAGVQVGCRLIVCVEEAQS